jgi:hypothetical protein
MALKIVLTLLIRKATAHTQTVSIHAAGQITPTNEQL